MNGGVPLTLTNFSVDVPFGADWDERGTILYGLGDGIWEVPDSGGEPRQVIAIEPGEQAASPQRLPDGDRVLFTLARATGPNRWNEADIVVESLESGERQTIWSGGGSARYVPTGHLVFSQDDVLYAMPFDAERLEVSGVPTPVVEGVRRAVNPEYSYGAAFYAFSQQGTLIYVPSTGESTALTALGIADRNGQAEPLAMPAGAYDDPRASPDGRRIAFTTVYGDGTDISVYEIGSGNAPRRLTFGGGTRYPIWSSDGERVAFQNVEEEGASIFWQAADGSGLEEQLTTAEDGAIHVPDSFSSDGAWLSFTVSSGSESAVWLLSVATGDADLLIAEPGARLSQRGAAQPYLWRLTMKRLRLLVILLGLWPGTGMAQTTDELINDRRNTDNVTTQSIGYDRKSYSPLAEINRSTVERLVPIWNASLMNDLGELAAPTVYNGVMYVINGKWTFAIDVETGRQIWRTPVALEPETQRTAII